MDTDTATGIRWSVISGEVVFGLILGLAGLFITLSPVLVGLHPSFLAAGLVFQVAIVAHAAIAIGAEIARAREVRAQAVVAAG